MDAAIMTAIITPLLYFLSFKPLLLQIQQRARVEKIIQTRLRLMQYAETHPLDELLQFILDEIEALTGSSTGFILPRRTWYYFRIQAIGAGIPSSSWVNAAPFPIRSQ
jgi:hypothetical protein